MKILDVINSKELTGVKQIKCTVLLKSSWNHSEFSGVVVKGEHTGDGSAKLMTVDQMKAFCNGNPSIEFVNVKDEHDVIFKFVNPNIGFSINMNSDTFTEVISTEMEEIHPISLSPILKIDEEYSKGFRISADNKVISSEYYTDYEIIIGLEEIIGATNPSKYLIKATNPREMAIEIMDIFKFSEDVAKSMEVFGK